MRIRSVTFIVDNIRKSVNFYEKIGFKVSQNSDHRVCFKLENKNQHFYIMRKDDYKYPAGQQMCSFYRSNVDGFFEKCKLMGVPLEKELKDSPEGRTFAFRDLDGNKIEIIETPQEDFTTSQKDETEIPNQEEQGKETKIEEPDTPEIQDKEETQETKTHEETEERVLSNF